MQYIAATCTDVGNSKNINQDSLNVMIANTQWGQIAMAVICDGVGGLSCGEYASAQVVLAFKKWFSESLPLLLDSMQFYEELKEHWRKLIQKLNEEILLYATERHLQMGTTLTAALLMSGKYYMVHVGDSRAYQITHEIQQLTKDQTVTAREVELGHITLEQAKIDSRRHVLLQCIGANSQIVPEFLCGTIPKVSSYLFCTDGLYNRLTDQEIYEKCQRKANNEQRSMEEHLQELVRSCKCRGEQDNISVILLQTYG